MEKLLLIDGNSLMHRAFYAIPSLATSKGVPTNAVFGFTNMIFRLLKEEKPDYMAVAFDKKAPTFRHIEFQDYKATRAKAPEELLIQFPLLKEILSAMNIKFLEVEGFEADDVLGTLSKKAEEKGLFTLIVTGDKDALQLISEKTHVMLTKKGITEMEVYDQKKFYEKYELNPSCIPDLKGLMGDASDNIPGVPGVGEKTAIKLLKEFENLENLYESLSKEEDERVKGKLKENLLANKDQALKSKRLATIIRDVPIIVDFMELRVKDPDKERLISLFKELEFNSLIKRISVKIEEGDEDKAAEKTLKIKEEIEEEPQEKAYIIKDREDLYRLKEDAKNAGMLSVFLSQNRLLFSEGRRVFSLSLERLQDNDVKNQLREIFLIDSIRKIAHDGKMLIEYFAKLGISFSYEFDTMIASYLINSSKNRYDLESVAYEYLGVDLKDKADEEKCFSLIPLEGVLEERLKNDGLEGLFYFIEMPLCHILADMEMTGFKVDREKLKKLSNEFGERLIKLTEEIYELAGISFNINSTKQLGEVLFEKLQLPTVKKKKTGYSTDAEVLEKLRGAHPIIEKLLEYRFLMKMKSTYADGLLNMVDKETSRIHTSFNQTITATGRISSTEPNLQNIPVKTEIGKKIRGVFVADGPGHILLSADYSQIELRILAHVSGDEKLIESFIKGEDIHTRTASEVFGVPLEKVTPEMRNRAKAVNFGIIYGISDFGLAQSLNISTKEAKEYIENYFKRYPKVKEFIDETIKKAKTLGYVTTIFNRRRYLPEISSRNFNLRSFAERAAVNSPIQGSAADIIKLAMVKIYRELKRRGYRTRLLLQIHDELIFDVPLEELDSVRNLVKYQMEKVVELRVPLTVDMKEGFTWEELK